MKPLATRPSCITTALFFAIGCAGTPELAPRSAPLIGGPGPNDEAIRHALFAESIPPDWLIFRPRSLEGPFITVEAQFVKPTSAWEALRELVKRPSGAPSEYVALDHDPAVLPDAMRFGAPDPGLATALSTWPHRRLDNELRPFFNLVYFCGNLMTDAAGQVTRLDCVVRHYVHPERSLNETGTTLQLYSYEVTRGAASVTVQREAWSWRFGINESFGVDGPWRIADAVDVSHERETAVIEATRRSTTWQTSTATTHLGATGPSCTATVSVGGERLDRLRDGRQLADRYVLRHRNHEIAPCAVEEVTFTRQADRLDCKTRQIQRTEVVGRTQPDPAGAPGSVVARVTGAVWERTVDKSLTLHINDPVMWMFVWPTAFPEPLRCPHDSNPWACDAPPAPALGVPREAIDRCEDVDRE